MMRPKVLEENIDNFNSVSKDTIERLAKIRGTGGLEDGEIPDLEGELGKWATESTLVQTDLFRMVTCNWGVPEHCNTTRKLNKTP